MQRLILLAIVLFLSSCGDSNSWTDHLNGSLSPESTLKHLDVSYYLYDDEILGGKGAYAIQLIVKNNSDEAINNCIIVLNKKYSAKLEHVEYYFGDQIGNRRLKRNHIEAKETLDLIFSHDNNNYYIFQDLDRNYLPNDKRITEVTVLSSDGTARFNFTR